ncbi:uncharacterized protein LOC126794118 [Argentina anserina]|uniref:uncharacterized protein LOC126794118 n=1 Tax=Argentina anserina TaxID=57926 RepID=UPI0021768F4C|nr:uncharacterized protein LOC126794118 [Potentilla anserina]XP_050376728.1 uncharacterized protein LOC126794118 [Potentilla anserina]
MENVPSSLTAEKLETDTLAIKNEEQGEPSKDLKSPCISGGGPKLDYNHGEDKLVDKTDISGDLYCKDQGDKLDTDQCHRDMGVKSSDSSNSKFNTEVIEMDSERGQMNPADKVDLNAKEQKLDNDQGDKLENDKSRRDMCEKNNDSKDFEFKTQERELSSNKGYKSPADKVESDAKEEDLYNDGKHVESKALEETDKAFGKDKEPEPVYDRTEVSGLEAQTSLSIHSLDHDSETSGVVEKAVALKNFVKVKSVVAVSSFLRRISGYGNEDGPDVAAKNFSDSSKDSEVGVASQSTLEKSLWNPLSFIKMYQDVDGTNKADGANDEPGQPLAMKGRIILYTRLGCQDCKDARLFLYWKKLRYTEINLDVYPSRKQEIEKFSGSSTVPKVFFNEVLIGGMSELKGLDDSGKLDEKIDYLISEAPSFEAPLPPLSGEDDVSNSGAIDELAIIVRKMKEFVVVKDQLYKMHWFTKSFSGSEAVDFLSEDQYLEREEAIEFGRKLASKLFFQHVLEENLFEDGNHLYRFLDDDPVVSQCHNIPKGIIDVKPKPINQIASRLRFIMCAILEAYISEDGKHIDYRSIHGSEEFARYLRTVEELHRVELQDLRREDSLAFFINLYNMMAIHAILVWGHPDGGLERRKLFGDFKYVIGGSAYSLSDIQNGILRGNQRPPYNLMKPFNPKDKRAMMALPYPEPLIHFALVFGTRSGPVLRCYSPGDIDQELMEAARSFLQNGGLIIDFDTKVASATKILKWFSIDFGKNEMEVLKHSSNYLEPSISEALLELLATSQLKVIYQPYDWGLNC